MEVDHQIVWVTTLSPDARSLAWCQADLDKILTGVTVTPTAPAAPAPPDPGPAAPDSPPPAGGATVTIAGLVGTWGVGGGATITGGQSSFFSEWYTVKADGSYTYSFQGRANNHTIRETGAGKLTFAGDLLVFEGTREGTRQHMKLHLIDFQAGKDGSGVLTLLDESYPTTPENIGLYKQAWIREPAKKK